MFRLFLVLSALLVTNLTFAIEPEVDPIKVDLFVDPVEQQSGSMFIGAHFTIEPNWHLYWRYPGDTGLPTQVKFTLPEGGTSGPILWPSPVKFSQAGGLVGFGYEHEVVLMSEVKIPPGKSAEEISIDARWVGCSIKLCVPGKASFKLKGSELGKTTTSKIQDLSVWRDKLPKEINPGIALVEVHRSPVADAARQTFEVVYDWKSAPGKLEWFPDLGRNFKIFDTNIKTEGQRSVVTFSLERLATAPADLKEISAEVVQEQSGKRVGFGHKIEIN